ncbi:hypothetical protein AX14_010337, partial [Amanita brunnescens Koide BX004]
MAHTHGSVENVENQQVFHSAQGDLSDDDGLVSIPLLQWAPKKLAQQVKSHPNHSAAAGQALLNTNQKVNSDPFVDDPESSLTEPDAESLTEPDKSVTEDDRGSEGEAVEMSDDEEANDVTVNTTAAKKKFAGKQPVWSDQD